MTPLLGVQSHTHAHTVFGAHEAVAQKLNRIGAHNGHRLTNAGGGDVREKNNFAGALAVNNSAAPPNLNFIADVLHGNNFNHRLPRC